MEEQKLNINLSPEVAEGNYSNLAIVAHSSSEFVVDFVRMMPGQKSANVQSRNCSLLSKRTWLNMKSNLVQSNSMAHPHQVVLFQCLLAVVKRNP